MKSKQLLSTVFLLFILFLFQNQVFAQNAYSKANNLIKIIGDKKISNSIDSFNANFLFWHDMLKNDEEDYLNILHFTTFIQHPFSENINLNYVKPSIYTALAKKYNYFSVQNLMVSNTTRGNTNSEQKERNNDLKRGNVEAYKIDVPRSYEAGFTPSVVIDGAARFLVKRTKEELEAAFFEKFRDEIEKDTFLRYMIPETYLLLRFQDYAYIPSMGQTWTTAMASDLNNIPFGLSDAIIKTKPEMLEKNEVLVFLSSMMAAKQLQDGAKPYEILYSIDKKFGDSKNKNLANHIHFTNLLSVNLLQDDYKGKDNAWITADDYKLLKVNGQKYFWAYIVLENLSFFEKTNWKPTQFEKIFTQLQTVEDFLQYAQKTGEILTSNEYTNSKLRKTADVTENLVNMIGAAVKMDFLLRNENDAYYDGIFVKKYLPLTQNSIAILKNADEKNYGAVMLSTLRVVNELFTQEQQQADKTLKTSIFYLNFLTDVITSKEAADVQQVIERYALPTQSYRLKRSNKHSISISAYPGIYSGGEYLTSTKNKGIASGVTAPIGFSADWGKLGRKNNQSLAFFVPVIDIGAAFSYRWDKDANGKGFPSDISWKQIFSPGLYLYWGLPKSPLSLGAGIQWAPQLRKITQSGSLISENAIRIGVNAAVDLPIFNLWRKY